MISTTPKPNVLVILADQHRWDCIGANGNPDIKTPNLDKLATEGTSYHNSFTVFPVCTPSRYSLLCGKFVRNHCCWTNHATLRQEFPTFARTMRNNGYSTAAVGKMHFSPTYIDVGFERMKLCEQHGDGRWDDDYHRELRKLDLVDRLDLLDQRDEYFENAPPVYHESCGSEPTNLPEHLYSTEWIAGKALEEIDNWNQDGNLLMVGFVKPHHPFDPPQKWWDMYDPEELSLLPGWTEHPLSVDMDRDQGRFPHPGITPERCRNVMARYYAAISEIDEKVGELVCRLKQKNMLDNTIIIYTSDHGDYMGFHHMILKSNHLYDPLIKVPLIIRYPEAFKPSVSDRMVSNIDIFPTLVELAGLPEPENLPGISVLNKQEEHELIFSEVDRGYYSLVRSRRYKFIRDRRNNLELLFDLETDPFEEHNVADNPEYADTKKQLAAALDNWEKQLVCKENHLDENAPAITAPNVPENISGHRISIGKWYNEKMKKEIQVYG
jgi:arylsulfatase